MNINSSIKESDIEYPNCPVCNGSSRKIKISGRPFSLVGCNLCRLNYIYPRIKEKIGIKLYEKLYLKKSVVDIERRFTDCNRFMWNIGKLIPYVKTNKRNSLLIYDLGCGGGGFVHLSKYIFGEAKGFDLEPSAKSLADTKYSYLDVKNINDLKKYPKADMVSCLHVFEHLYNPRKFLKTLLKPCLKKGGVALIEVPNWGSRQARKQKSSWGWYQPREHIIQFTSSPLKKLLELEGFQILNIYEDFPISLGIIDEISIKTATLLLVSKILDMFGLKSIKSNKKGSMLGVIVRKL